MGATLAIAGVGSPTSDRSSDLEEEKSPSGLFDGNHSVRRAQGHRGPFQPPINTSGTLFRPN